MKKLIYGVVFLISTILIGCGISGPLPYHYIKGVEATNVATKVVPIYIDTQFGEADKLAIDDAVNQWNYALNGYIKLEVASTHFDMEPDIISQVLIKGNGWLFLRIDSQNSIVHDPTEGKVLAFVNEIGGNRIYFVRDRFSNEAVKGIALHEIGHLLGAQHDNVYLMKPHYNWYDYRCVDQHTIEEVATYQHLDIKKLNYCVYGYETVSQEKVK